MIYFDNAATSLHKPASVAQAVYNAINTLGNSGRGAHGPALEAARTAYETREALAQLFGVEDCTRIAFTSNATESLNAAIKGLIKSGDHVITTQLEHNSVLRPLFELENKGVELTIVDSDSSGVISLSDVERSIQNHTRAIICTHGSNVTGNVLDIESIGQICQKHSLLFILDAAQTAGVFPIHVEKQKIDVLCFSGHKGLLGPQGTGGLYVKEGLSLTPLITGGSGIDTFNKNHPAVMPEALEGGTLNIHGIAGLLAGLKYIHRMGTDTIRRKEQDLAWEFYLGVRNIPGVEIYGDFSTPNRCGIVSLNIKDYDSAIVSDLLANEYMIHTRAGGHCAPLMHQALGTQGRGLVRFSFSHFNTMEEITYGIQAVREIAARFGGGK